jgi:hypothetical protein
MATGQVVTPVWVQHLNGLVNTDATNQLPILRKNVGGTENNNGESTMVSLGKMIRYDAGRYLLMVRENGINETTASDPDKALAAAYPDRSLIWIDAATGRPLGIAHVFGVTPITVTGQLSQLDFYSQWGIDEGPEGSRVLYSTHKNVILRWAPKAGGGWESTPTCAWVEPTPSAKDCAGTDLDGSSSGEGSDGWRWRNFRVTGAGANTVILAGGGTWRSSMHPQIFKTTDGLKFLPVARVNDRDGGTKGNYSLGGLSSHVVKYGLDSSRPNLEVLYHGHYPGTDWLRRPDRYVNDPSKPFRTIDDSYATGGTVQMFESGDVWNDGLSGNFDYPTSPAGPNGQFGDLPAFRWEAAGKDDLPIVHSQDGYEYYDGNWSCTLEANSSVDYVVNYSMPSWNNLFGSIKKPGWIGVHRLDGSIAANASYKLPFTEMDIATPDEGVDVGNGWGYDGDLTLYPDTTAPANLKKSTLFWVGSAYGYGVFTVQNLVATIVAEPQDQTLTENSPLTITAEISGSPNSYQWFKDGVALDGTRTNADGTFYYPRSVVQGVNKAELYLPQAAQADSGKYKLVATNPLGPVTTREAQISVVTDNIPPTIASLKVGRSANGSFILVTYSEQVTAATASNAANYQLSGGITINGAEVADASSAIVYCGVLSPGTSYTLTVNGVRDISANANVIAQNTQKELVGPSLTPGKVLWEFWPGIDGNTTDAIEGDARYPAKPMRWEYMNDWSTDNNGLRNVADSFGARISGWISPTESGSYRFFIDSDDNSKLYLNPSGPDAAGATEIASEFDCCNGFLEPNAVDPDSNGSKQTSDAYTLAAGTSYYIYLVYKEGGGNDWAKVAWRKEGDSTPAANLNPIPGAVLSAYAPAVPSELKFDPPLLVNGKLRLSWTGTGTLLQSTDLQNWSPVPGNPASPYEVTPEGTLKFYRLQQ